MSLLVDKDYLILQLRLAYLRKVDDHHGPRVISVPDIVNLPAGRAGAGSGYQQYRQGSASSIGGNEQGGLSSFGISNTSSSAFGAETANRASRRHVYAPDSAVFVAGLNDARYQPELATLHSPKITDEYANQDGFWAEQRRISESAQQGSTSAGSALKSASSDVASSGLGYTTTIYGPGRTGALGMRTTGRRTTSTDTRRRTRRRSSEQVSSPRSANTDLQGRRLSKEADKPVPRRLSDLAGEGNAREYPSGAGTPPYRNIPKVQVQGSSYDSEFVRPSGSRRSSSLRVSQRFEGAPQEDAAQGARVRSQSSSQPQRPSQVKLLGSPGGSHRVSITGGEGISQSETEIGPHDVPAVSTRPPPRPERDARRRQTDERYSQAAAQRHHWSSEGDDRSPDAFQYKQRSASDGVQQPVNPTLLDTGGSTYDSAFDTTQEYDHFRADSSALPSIERSMSDMTIFSLASPRAGRNRGLSLQSERGGEVGKAGHDTLNKDAVPPARVRAASFAPLTEVPENQTYPETPTSSDPLSPLSRARAFSDPREAGDRRRSEVTLHRSSPRDVTGEHDSYRDGFAHLSTASDPHGNDLGPSAPDPSSSVQSIAPITTALELDPDELRSPNENEAGGFADVRSPRDEEAAFGDAWKHKTTRKSQNMPPSLAPGASDLTFEKRNVGGSAQGSSTTNRQTSALSKLLQQHSDGPSNAFSHQYKGVAGSSVANGASTTIDVFFPFARAKQDSTTRGGKPKSGAVSLDPRSRSMQLSVRKDATMEELIGYSLYCYVEERWQPPLEEALPAEATDEQRDIRLSTVGWSIRIVEDGEVDEDYPALDRSLTVGKFGADELAICEATPSQIKQNQAMSTEQRTARVPPLPPSATRLQPPRQSLHPASASARLAATAGNAPAGSLISVQGTPIFSSSVLGDQQGMPMQSMAAPIFLRVLVTPNPEVRYKTTLQVTKDRYLADVLETICKRRDLGSPDKWALVVSEKDIVVPLDRTVESLQGNYDLALVRRQDLGEHQSGALTSQSTNPNASIFKRMSHPAQPRYQTAAKQLASTFKSYTVNRRMPTFLGRHERVLTIDGTWIHVIPTDTRAFHTNVTTTSFPASAIISCTQSRLPSMFKLVIARETDQKRYDFEAESSKVAVEIVGEINKLLRNSSQAQSDEAAALGPGPSLAGLRGNSDKK